MAFCTQCGQRLPEEGEHVCTAIAHQETAAAAAVPAVPKVDTALLVQLLKNPQLGLSLHPEKDLVTGFIGMGASILGFFIFGLALKNRLIDSMFGSIKVKPGDFGGLFDSAAKSAANRIPLATNMLWLGIISLLVLLAVLALVGNWQGQRKLGWKEVVTYFGSMQLLSGAGFAAAAVVAFASVRFALILVAINLLTTLLLTCISALDVYQIGTHKRLVALGVAMAAYVVVVLIASNSLLKSAAGSLF